MLHTLSSRISLLLLHLINHVITLLCMLYIVFCSSLFLIYYRLDLLESFITPLFRCWWCLPQFSITRLKSRNKTKVCVEILQNYVNRVWLHSNFLWYCGLKLLMLLLSAQHRASSITVNYCRLRDLMLCLRSCAFFPFEFKYAADKILRMRRIWYVIGHSISKCCIGKWIKLWIKKLNLKLSNNDFTLHLSAKDPASIELICNIEQLNIKKETLTFHFWTDQLDPIIRIYFFSFYH